MKKLLKGGKKVLDANKFFSYIKKFVLNMGQKLVYSSLLMFYAYKRNDTPAWAKNIILGTLAYVLAPFDAVPDLTPLFGFTDDLGILGFGLVTIACYINEDVRGQSIERMGKMFKQIDEKVIAEVNSTL
jgi:uncharacterized membrane protein YkvA (DUF1232 family)